MPEDNLFLWFFIIFKSSEVVCLVNEARDATSEFHSRLADHQGYIRHCSDVSIYEVNFLVTNMMQKFERLLMQANDLRTMIHRPRNETMPVLTLLKEMMEDEIKT